MTWQLNDGSGANNLSATATTIIDLRPNPTNDFNGDKISDLLFENNAVGNKDVMIDLFNGTSITSSATIANPSGLQVEASGDFNHDGKADIVLQARDGTPQIWFMNGTSVTSTVTLPDPGPGWHVIATGDFNGDGNTDILWQNNDGTPGDLGDERHFGHRRRRRWPIPERPGTSSGPATSMATASPTSCGRTTTARRASGR